MSIVDVGKRSVAAFGEDKVTRLAQAIAFSTVFSLAPLIIVLVAVLGAFAGSHHEVEDKLLASVSSSAGKASADQIRALISASYDKPRQGAIAQIVGWATFVLGATNLFGALQDALNTIWSIEKLKGGWRVAVRARLKTAAVLVAVVLVLLATFVANAVVAYVTQHLQGSIPIARSPVLLTVAAQAVSLVAEAVAFALLFKLLPAVDLSWRRAFVGGGVTALLFTIGQIAIGIYFTRGGVTSAYGAAGSLLVMLLWIYYSTLIILFGAEITKVTAGDVALTADAAVARTDDKTSGDDPR